MVSYLPADVGTAIRRGRPCRHRSWRHRPETLSQAGELELLAADAFLTLARYSADANVDPVAIATPS